MISRLVCQYVRPAISQAYARLVIASLVALLSLLTSCNKEAEQQGASADTTTVQVQGRTYPLWQDTLYRDWVTETSGIVLLRHPVTHQHAADMPTIAQGYMSAIRVIADRLNKTVPSDTIPIYYYTGPWQGENWTGNLFPYADTTGIHYWPSWPRGVGLMQYLLSHWYPEGPAQPVIHHGLIALFDFDSKNYHAITLDMLNSDTMFVPLTRLVTDTAINSTEERRQSAEAASLVGFLIGQYGPNAVDTLYRSPGPLDVALQQVTGKPVDSLQSEWLAYARAVVPAAAP